MLAVEPGTRSGEDPEDLHKMRVATRRQRAAWRVFGDAYDAKRTKRHRDRLRDVARRLGAVRDLDVLIELLDGYAKEQSEAEGTALQPLRDSWRTRRDEARALLIKELDSQKHLDWLDDYREFVQTEGRGTVAVSATIPHRVRDTMPSRIWAAYEGVRGYEPVLRWADIPTLHELRIGGKWLRYTLEFVREALGPEATLLIDKVVALQDHLGLLNDADVAANLARQFLVDHAGTLDDVESAAIGRYLVDRERERARLRRTIGHAWGGVAGLTFRRQLGRLTAGL
jgi:CHAD domain-containing protein